MKRQAPLLVLLWVGLLSLPHSYSAIGQTLVDSNNQPMVQGDPLLNPLKAEIIGTEAPQLHLQTINGTWYTPENLRGKVIVLNFWYINCIPCKKDKPILNTLAQKYAEDDRVVFLSIAKDRASSIRKFLEKNPINTPIQAEGDDTVEQFQVKGYPTTVVIDRRGRYFGFTLGPVNQVRLDQQIREALLGKKPDPKNHHNPYASTEPSKPQSLDKLQYSGKIISIGTDGKRKEEINDGFKIPTDIRDEEGNPISFIQYSSMAYKGEYQLEPRVDAQGRKYDLMRKSTPEEKEKFQKIFDQMINSDLFQEIDDQNKNILLEAYPPVDENTVILDPQGQQIDYNRYVSYIESGKWTVKGVLKADGSLDHVQLEALPPPPKK